MARTPSMSVAECEAALGPRGHLFVNADNHPLVRKWLTANGVKGLYAAGLARKYLAAIYNDTSNDALNKARGAADEAATEYGTDEEVTAFEPVQSETRAETSDTVSRLSKLLAELASKGAVDETQVTDIVNKKWAELPALIEKHSSVTRIEIKASNGDVKAVEGRQHPQFAKLVKAMASRMANGFHPNILLVGPTGSGKTYAFEQACKALGLEAFFNGAVSMDHQLLGYRDAAGNYHTTPLREAFAKKAGYLFDEIDSSDNSPLLALSGALANGSAYFPDGLIDRNKDCVIVAAGNTWGHGANSDFVGRNKLDGAIRSRFPVRIHWDYDEKLERDICGNVDWACRVQKARAKARSAGLKVIIDPRMSQAGSALIGQGFSFDEAADMTYLADLTPEQRKLVEA